MNQKDNWGAFLKWANDKTKLEGINKLIESEGGITMAAQALRGISLNEIMQIRAIEAEKKVKDYLSDMARSKREGLEQGLEQGEQIGLVKDAQNKMIEIARKQI
ncbi:MAG: hypothetical protein LBJ32_04420 [Oscillospiraceae bacterium]|jgi:hypothetical protein|nr:hypothetical protein [Oscillospiraceae bacterium]